MQKTLTSPREPLRPQGHSRIPPRYALLLWVGATFLAVNTLVRLGLIGLEGDWSNAIPGRLVRILATGALYDLAAASYLLLPFALLALVWPGRGWGRRAHAISASMLFSFALVGMLLTGLSEGIFWNEFASRFNFIAVDYLVYSREVLGNIRQSYPVGRLLAAVAGVGLLIGAAIARPVWRAAMADGGNLWTRCICTGLLVLLAAASWRLVDDTTRESVETPAARELAGNGYYEFARALRNNDLDFRAFYRTLPPEVARDLTRRAFAAGGGSPAFLGGPHPLERKVSAPRAERAMNVVMVSMESLGSDFVESFGGKPGLTPNLDRLAQQGLAFTRLYATGLRTVRGLEALTLSVPPTPGHAVPMRKHNTGFQTIGGVFKEHGYEALYLYGGYGVFDNMTDFFGGNGYRVIDRSAIPANAISHETIWGVADEDLFRQAIREIDQRTAAGGKVFAHVMTTSNHRPFTYPAGRIDIASGTGRDGAVKYADWAIGAFMREAAQRPWFKNTVFVFVADHTSHGRGRSDLPPENYRIPLIVYAPGFVAPGLVDTVASQIDVAPTLLALLDMSYTSRFFGQDILTDGQRHQRAFMANYLTVGYMEGGLVAELGPKRQARVVDALNGDAIDSADPRARRIIDQAVAQYQLATDVLRGGVGAGDHPAERLH